jgi:ABC-type glutathione transport system ATPase component
VKGGRWTAQQRTDEVKRHWWIASGTQARSTPAVEVHDLVKRYPKSPVNAVDGVSFAVTPGEVVGLLGPNGPARRPPSAS